MYQVLAPNTLCTFVISNTLGMISSMTTLYRVPVLTLLYNILHVTLSPIVAVVLFTIFVICSRIHVLLPVFVTPVVTQIPPDATSHVAH